MQNGYAVIFADFFQAGLVWPAIVFFAPSSSDIPAIPAN